MTKHTSGLIIPKLTSNTSSAEIQTGTCVPLDDGGTAMYVQAGSEIAQYNAVAIGFDETVVNCTTAAVTEATGTSRKVGFAQTSIASGNYGWVQLSGRPKVKLAANCADKVALYTTSTAGTLDDAVVSVGEVVGVVSKTTISNATAVTVLVGPAGAFIQNYALQA